MLSKMLVGNISPSPEYYTYKPNNKLTNLSNIQKNSTFESAYELINIQKISQYAISIASSNVRFEPFRSSTYVYLQSVDKVDFLFNKISQFSTTNFYN